MAKQKLLNVEALRGVAATLVVLYHVDKYYYDTPRLWAEKLFGGLFSFGHAGVEFFFVLSGFIIALIHAGDGGQPGKILPFLEKRFVRIYPFYWVCLAIVIVSMLVVPGVLSRISLDAVVGSIFLVGIDPFRSVVFVAWTLFHEVLFYAVFCLFIWNRKMGVAAIVAWSLGSYVLSFFGRYGYVVSPMNILFIFGIGCALVLQRHRIPAPVAMAVAGSLGFLLIGLDDSFWHVVPRMIQIPAYGVASAAALLGFVEMERSKGIHAGRLAVTIGQASYSIYLTHMLTLTAMTKIAIKLKLASLIPGSVAFLIFCVAALVGGVAIHRWVEKPLMAAARALLRRLRLAAPQKAVAG
ncbi:acyltransferase family protein [Sphingomonas sanxanigenens]|uniref:Acyltransferase 3 domain-containing protein n=1 Tax=Sphingomonas sanxanigenens DSM 19645 = NX02 TaxID=1123269 RepID=W0AIQ2_9SPHN|nr:acyltransferase [Sphingomonas sanxanigenens]AHE56447.1 hypothetical protein NX02_24195 [Sphingomonas sanxanigenens DSM 19645 = NX02]